MIRMKLWFCLVIIVTLTACTENTHSSSKYALVVGAGRGKLLFGHRVVYIVDEYGNLLNLEIPKEEELGNDPEWSPDGEWIVQSYLNPNPKSASDYDIYLVDLRNQNNPIRITQNLISPNSPDWSPNGTQIAFYAYDANSRDFGIYLLDVKCVLQNQKCTSKPTFLISGDYPDWSPDGKKIVYRDRSRSEIYIVDVQNPVETVNISEGLGSCSSPQWSPDGTKIAFVCNETVYIVDPDGGNPVSLVSGSLYLLRWSPDGKKIAFIGTDALDPNLGQVLDLEGTIGSTAVFIMDANGVNVKRITRSNEESIGWFAWISTDGIKTK